MGINISQNIDLTLIAKCHRSAFSKSLSSKLGIAYCAKMISWYIENNRGILFHLSQDNQVIGYCGGLIRLKPNQHGSATSMTQHSFSAFIFSILIRPWLLFHPELLSRIPFIWKNIRIKLGITGKTKLKSANQSSQVFVPSMGLVVIGISPEHQGKGYGSILLKEFERQALQRGIHKIDLSVKQENLQAIAAYQKNGWLIGSKHGDSLSMYKEI